MVNYFKTLILGVILLIAGCKTEDKTMHPAESGLDAGREFLEACNKGDFSRAAFYMLPDNSNEGYLKNTEAAFRKKDKEEREQLRTASINIQSVDEPTDSTVLMQYSNSVDTRSKKLSIIRRNNQWMVDYKKTFQ
ncbi:MAG: DUF4878 domain-containing protein [Sphingobacteriia bacterium]|nr:DUF4878 domain-containing protein [Sphingobacteriia bacterium]